MEKKVQNINGEEQYKDIIKSLKELPKIKAPDNFELKLMTRIHNKNFNIERDKSFNFTIWGFLKPAMAVSLTAVVIFFVIDVNSFDSPNLLLTEPELRKDILGDDKEVNVPLQNEFIVEETIEPEAVKKDELNSGLASSAPAVKNQGYKVVINENDVISREKFELPVDDKSVDVDSRLKEAPARTSKRAFLVGGAGEKRKQVFDGFHTRSLENQWLQDSSAKYSDSLQNAGEKSNKK